MSVLDETGFAVFGADPTVARWAVAAHAAALKLTADPALRETNLRHGNTWFVGVDALPNAPDGSVDGVALAGDWQQHVRGPPVWHRAQVSVIYPGYPQQDADESHAAHRFRVRRHAAHVDGLLPEGPLRRRFLREPHAFILGLPLNRANAAPLMVWPGSHYMMGQAFRDLIGERAPGFVDLTDGYQAARRAVFDQIDPIALHASPGQAILLHRHLLHGVAAWSENDLAPPEGRMVAYFRPEFSGGTQEWLCAEEHQSD